MKNLLLYLVIFPIQFINHGNGQRKIISDSQYNYTFYVSQKNINTYIDSKTYYWYKSGKIHISKGGSNGDLLDGKYTKSDKDNNISEQGIFKIGLKDSVWKEWHPNGMLKSITRWNKGYKSGLALKYDENGGIIEKGKFRKNKKHGIWINEEVKDTLYFKNGEQIEIQEKKKLTEKVKLFFNNLFGKKEQKNKEQKDRISRKNERKKVKKDKSSSKEKDKTSK